MQEGWDTNAYCETLRRSPLWRVSGRVAQAVGMTVESNGPVARVGDLCSIETDAGPRFAEVVGFRNRRLILMPFSDLDRIHNGAVVKVVSEGLRVPTGPGILGRVLDGLGRPIDGLGPVAGEFQDPIEQPPPPPMARTPVNQPLSVGVRAIDGLLTVGQGQRIGIFAGSGVGKSTLLGMIARYTEADVTVIGLIGERGREVQDFIARELDEEGRKRAVVVAATSDQPPLMRIKGALTATAMAERFRRQGRRVLLLMDSVTRFAMACREVGLAAGEPPTARGYTPSVFAALPKLLERTGTARTGSITAFYTVLVEGDDFNEPIADAVRGILDGHIVLSRKIAQQGLYPAIDVTASTSRLMNQVAETGHIRAAARFKALLAAYEEAEDLIQIGAYREGTRREVDTALRLRPRMWAYLAQNRDVRSDMGDAVRQLVEMFNEEGGG
ncbi:FliI/YscN family ATPase [Kyrpidia sp.]|uniref:FliI/YscN family ATPase n=1 Tax=Kyrpidia sp. TaxID=2073077 RepID=UPI0025904527|nr:FliI/YscN family ATPase [Kyrpidia sp.]MCL6574762.1 FliI/YscN family ATPase [Kyrpidia sp.]